MVSSHEVFWQPHFLLPPAIRSIGLVSLSTPDMAEICKATFCDFALSSLGMEPWPNCSQATCPWSVTSVTQNAKSSAFSFSYLVADSQALLLCHEIKPFHKSMWEEGQGQNDQFFIRFSHVKEIGIFILSSNSKWITFAWIPISSTELFMIGMAYKHNKISN